MLLIVSLRLLIVSLRLLIVSFRLLIVSLRLLIVSIRLLIVSISSETLSDDFLVFQHIASTSEYVSYIYAADWLTFRVCLRVHR